MDPNNNNNTFRTIGIFEFVRNHPGNFTTRTRISSSDIPAQPTIRRDLPSTSRPNLSLPSTLPTPSLFLPETHFSVPSTIFAESCPVCDEVASESVDPEFVAKYPKGWVLVTCKRHSDLLKTNNLDTRKLVWVGGNVESTAKAAERYEQRKELKAMDKATAAVVVAAENGISTTPRPSPSIPSTSPPTNLQPKTKQNQKPTDPCPVCVENTPNLTLDCGHKFCIPCLNNWQATCHDTNLSEWMKTNPGVRIQYPILQAHLKSRFTCPMCRAQSQFTKQSRRKKKKLLSRLGRGEEEGAGVAARSRRGGQRRSRARRQGAGVLTSHWVAPWMRENACDAADSMPVVQRAQPAQDASPSIP